MHIKPFVLSSIAALVAASGAQADLAFSFADPTPGRQLHNLQNGGGAGLGLLSYDAGAALRFLVDGSTEPTAFTFAFDNARLSLDLTLSPAVTVSGVTVASVVGSFTIYDASTPGPNNIILRGDATDGAFVRVGGTNSILFSSDTGFYYTAGTLLQALLEPGRTVVDPQEAVFTVTDIAVAGNLPLLAAGGVFRSFDANASFSGNSSVVPTPGTVMLGGLGAGLTFRRRRR